MDSNLLGFGINDDDSGAVSILWRISPGEEYFRHDHAEFRRRCAD